MKARMLCSALLVVFGTFPAEGRARSPLDSELEKALQEEESLNRDMLKTFAKEETLSFYKADWLNLRQRKKRALAAAPLDIKLRKNREVSN